MQFVPSSKGPKRGKDGGKGAEGGERGTIKYVWGGTLIYPAFYMDTESGDRSDSTPESSERCNRGKNFLMLHRFRL